MILEFVKNSFPFDLSDKFVFFSLYVLPWLSLFFLIILAALFFKAERKSYSMKAFLIGAILIHALLFIDMGMVVYKLHFLRFINIIWILVAPILLILSATAAISGFIEVFIRKLPKWSIILPMIATLYTLTYYIFLAVFAAVSSV